MFGKLKLRLERFVTYFFKRQNWRICAYDLCYYNKPDFLNLDFIVEGKTEFRVNRACMLSNQGRGKFVCMNGPYWVYFLHEDSPDDEEP